MGQTNTSYSVNIWDSDLQEWTEIHTGVSKWGLRPVLRELYRYWAPCSVKVCEEGA